MPHHTPKEIIPEQAFTMRGDEALARGALAAGVSLVTGYPGSPATGVFDALVRFAPVEALQAFWAPNEKVAMEIAIGASLAGKRSLVVLKSVGLNVGLDPLATFSYSGNWGGMVILLGDDPGAWGSQNEQDSRWLARVAEVPLIEPTDVSQAANLMAQAYAWSEAHHTPIIVRITRGFALEQGLVEAPWQLPPSPGFFMHQRGRWVVLPRNAVRRHRTLHRHLRELAQDLEQSPYDRVRGQGPLGVLAVGHTWHKVTALLSDPPPLNVLGLASVWPLPEASLVDWLRSLERLLILEEGSAFIEPMVRALCQRHRLSVEILGRETRTVPEEGELDATALAVALRALAPTLPLATAHPEVRSMPSKTPLCEGCSYWPVMEALIAAMEAHGGRQRHIVIGETGCMVRGDLPPLELFDVKYSLGASLGLGLGLALCENNARVVALVGDSAFFHSDINTLPEIARSNAPLTVLVLDNRVTALTGGQPHPGTPVDEHNAPRARQEIAPIVRAFGIEPTCVSSRKPAELRAALDAALTAPGPAFVIVDAPCIRYNKGEEV